MQLDSLKEIMDLQKKLEFVHKQTKLALEHVKHYDAGGVTSNTANGGLAGLLTPQSGYSAQLAPTTNLNYAPTVDTSGAAAQNGQIVNGAVGAEQGLAGQLGQISTGVGPNPAQTMLNQATGQNVANTAALQAGQRGAASNVGLIARQAGQQGAATQQGAVGQAASLQSQQQLNAINAQAALQNQIAQQGLGEQGVQSGVYGTATGANAAQNATNVNNYAQAQGINAQTAQANAAANQKTAGGLFGAAGSILGSIFYKGGEVEKYDAGGTVGAGAATGATAGATAGGAEANPTINGQNIFQFLGSLAQNMNPQGQAQQDPMGLKSLGAGIGSVASSLGLARGGYCEGLHDSHVANYFAQGGKSSSVKAMVSPGERYLNPEEVKQVQHGANPLKLGTVFKGQAKVKGDSLENDTIPVTLEDGGEVLPRHIENKLSPDKARLFILKSLAKKGLK
jgi:hypothetical protein